MNGMNVRGKKAITEKYNSINTLNRINQLSRIIDTTKRQMSKKYFRNELKTYATKSIEKCCRQSFIYFSFPK